VPKTCLPQWGKIFIAVGETYGIIAKRNSEARRGSISKNIFRTVLICKSWRARVIKPTERKRLPQRGKMKIAVGETYGGMSINKAEPRRGSIS